MLQSSKRSFRAFRSREEALSFQIQVHAGLKAMQRDRFALRRVLTQSSC
jgi:hypothetical protein